MTKTPMLRTKLGRIAIAVLLLFALPLRAEEDSEPSKKLNSPRTNKFSSVVQTKRAKSIVVIDKKTKKKVELSGTYYIRTSASPKSAAGKKVGEVAKSLSLTGKKKGDWLEVSYGKNRGWIYKGAIVSSSSKKSFAAKATTANVKPATKPARTAPRAETGRPSGPAPRVKAPSETVADTPAVAAPTAATATEAAPAATEAAPTVTESSSTATSEAPTASAPAAPATTTEAPATPTTTTTATAASTTPPTAPVAPAEPKCVMSSEEFERHTKLAALMPNPYKSTWQNDTKDATIKSDGNGKMVIELSFRAMGAILAVRQYNKTKGIPAPKGPSGSSMKEPYPMEICLDGETPYLSVAGDRYEFNDKSGSGFNGETAFGAAKFTRAIK